MLTWRRSTIPSLVCLKGGVEVWWHLNIRWCCIALQNTETSPKFLLKVVINCTSLCFYLLQKNKFFPLCKSKIQSQKSWKIIAFISNVQKHWCMIWIFWNYLAICLAFIHECENNRTISTTEKPNRPTVNYFRDTTQDPKTEHEVRGQIQGQFWYEDASWNLRAVPVNQGHLVTWLHTDICLNRLYDSGPVR